MQGEKKKGQALATTPTVKFWATVRRQRKAWLDHTAIFGLIILSDSDGLAWESTNCVPCTGHRC